MPNTPKLHPQKHPPPNLTTGLSVCLSIYPSISWSFSPLSLSPVSLPLVPVVHLISCLTITSLPTYLPYQPTYRPMHKHTITMLHLDPMSHPISILSLPFSHSHLLLTHSLVSLASTASSTKRGGKRKKKTSPHYSLAPSHTHTHTPSR